MADSHLLQAFELTMIQPDAAAFLTKVDHNALFPAAHTCLLHDRAAPAARTPARETFIHLDRRIHRQGDRTMGLSFFRLPQFLEFPAIEPDAAAAAMADIQGYLRDGQFDKRALAGRADHGPDIAALPWECQPNRLKP